MDDRQDVYRRWGGATADSPSPMATFVPIHIDENLRNTRKIAETFKPFAGEHFTPRGSTGLPVRRVDCATEEALDVAGDCLNALIDEGWANNQIALLTTKDRHPIHLDYFERGATEEYWRDFHANEGEFYGHVLGFKGLERSVVVLCVNGFKDMGRAPSSSTSGCPGHGACWWWLAILGCWRRPAAGNSRSRCPAPGLDACSPGRTVRSEGVAPPILSVPGSNTSCKRQDPEWDEGAQ